MSLDEQQRPSPPARLSICPAIRSAVIGAGSLGGVSGPREPGPRRPVLPTVGPAEPPARAPFRSPPARAPLRSTPAGRATERASRDLVRELARDVVDHALLRRAALGAVVAGRASTWDVCDAHPQLVAAARHHGVRIAEPCPLCRRPQLRWVHFVYGEALRHVAGQAKTPGELRRMAALSVRAGRRFDVYVVEVCPECRWNHLARSFVLGAEAGSDAGPGAGADVRSAAGAASAGRQAAGG